MLFFTRIHKEPKSLELFWEFSLAKGHAVHAESSLFSLVYMWSISRNVSGGNQVWRYVVFLIKKSVNRSPGMVNRAKGLRGTVFMDCSALIFLGWWQLGINLDHLMLSGRWGTHQELVSWCGDRLSCAAGRTCRDLYVSRENVLAFPWGWVVPSPGEQSGC